MALSETFPAARATRSLIPITARELVEWTYAVQSPDRGGNAIGGGNGISQTGLVIERLLLGCAVDTSRGGGGGLWGTMHCDEDALTVHGIVEGLPDRWRATLIDHGRSRTPPDWSPKLFPLRCVPVMGKRGSERGIYLGSGRDLVGHEVTYEGDWPSRDVATEHQIAADAHMRLWAEQSNWPATRRSRRSDRPVVAEHDWSPQPYRRCADEVLQRARDEYHAWYEALWALCDGLEAAGAWGLKRYRITALGAVHEPWSTQKTTD